MDYTRENVSRKKKKIVIQIYDAIRRDASFCYITNMVTRDDFHKPFKYKIRGRLRGIRGFHLTPPSGGLSFQLSIGRVPYATVPPVPALPTWQLGHFTVDHHHHYHHSEPFFVLPFPSPLRFTCLSPCYVTPKLESPRKNSHRLTMDNFKNFGNRLR